MEIILTIDLHAHFAPQELVEELTKRNIPPFVKKNSSGDRIFQMPHGILQFGHRPGEPRGGVTPVAREERDAPRHITHCLRESSGASRMPSAWRVNV